jgi:hypothetical protein
VVITVVLFAAAGLFELLIDMEENTRSSFRLQQLILEELQEGGTEAIAPAGDVTMVAAVPPPAAVAAPAPAPAPAVEAQPRPAVA